MKEKLKPIPLITESIKHKFIKTIPKCFKKSIIWRLSLKSYNFRMLLKPQEFIISKTEYCSTGDIDRNRYKLKINSDYTLSITGNLLRNKKEFIILKINYDPTLSYILECSHTGSCYIGGFLYNSGHTIFTLQKNGAVFTEKEYNIKMILNSKK